MEPSNDITGMVLLFGILAIASLAALIVGFKIVVGVLTDHEQRLHESYARVLDAKANVEQYGRAAMPESVTTDNTPQPEERLAAEVTEQAIERGFVELREQYRGMGIAADVMSDDAIRDEVIAILSQASGPARNPLLVTDG